MFCGSSDSSVFNQSWSVCCLLDNCAAFSSMCGLPTWLSNYHWWPVNRQINLFSSLCIFSGEKHDTSPIVFISISIATWWDSGSATVFQIYVIPPQSAPQSCITDPHLVGRWGNVVVSQDSCPMQIWSGSYRSAFTFLLSSSRTQMPIEPLWPWNNSEGQMKTSLAVKITQTTPVNLHKKQHAVFRAKRKNKFLTSGYQRAGESAVCGWMQRPYGLTGLWSVCWSRSQLDGM